MAAKAHKMFIGGKWVDAVDIMERRQDELVRAMMEEVGGTIGISIFRCSSYWGSTARARRMM
jgi:hypothetical protein